MPSRADARTGDHAAGGPPTEGELREVARREGRHNRPVRDATRPSAIEREAITWHQRELRKLNYSVAAEVDQLVATHRSLARLDSLLDLDLLEDEAHTELARLKARARNQLTALRREERDRLRDLNLFRRTHQLARSAIYPESRRLKFAIPCLLVAVESIANAWFFALGSSSGLIGGWFQALILSIVNVGGGFLVGWKLLSNALHKHVLRRVAGLSAFVGFWALSFLLNLSAAHYRDILENAPASALASAVSGALDAPFDLSPKALLLAVIGLAASAVAMYEGFTTDDPYPGYGGLDRRYLRARERYEEEERAFKDSILSATDRLDDRCAREITTRGERIDALERVYDQIRQLHEQYSAHRAELEERCQHLLGAFREENNAVRTADPPVYFTQKPEFPPYLKPASLDALEQEGSQVKKDLREQQRKLSHMKKELPKRIDREARSFESLVKEIAENASTQSDDARSFGLRNAEA